MKSFGTLFALACYACLLFGTTTSIAHQRPVVADQLRVSGVPVARPQEGLTTRSAVRLLLPMRQLLASVDLLPGTAGRTASTDQPSTTDIAAGMVAPTSVVTSAAEVHARSYLQQQAVRFVENRGQIADTDGRARPDILYTADAKGAQLYFRKDGVSYVFSKHEEGGSPSDDMGAASTAGAGPRRPRDMHAGERAASMVTTYRMDMHLVGARTDVRVRAYGAVEGVDNYYLAHCPDGVLGVQSFTRIVYENVYAHIDLEYLTSGGRMKYNFIVHPGGNVADIRMRFSGASSMAVDEDGDLHIETPLGSIEEAAPVTYQQAADTRRGIANEPVHSSYNLHEHDLTFEVAPYDPTRTLIIDPWATYYGGIEADAAIGIATVGNGDVVITGRTRSRDFPVARAVQSSFAGGDWDAFVVKLDGDGARLWATYYGGSDTDQASGIATDRSSNVVITGETMSSDFPIIGAVQSSYGGGQRDAFVVKLDAGGARFWATYYGGSGTDFASGIATDRSGNVVISGDTYSSDFPIVGAVQSAYAGDGDAFVVKLDAGGACLWATYYGGSDGDGASGIATDASGNVVISGDTSSLLDFPVADAIQPLSAGNVDAFIVKLDAGGARLWATYYGGSDWDGGRGIATDGSGNVVITGDTRSSDFPVAGAVQSAYAGDGDAFVVKLGAGGARLWATYYGGSDYDGAAAIVTDGSGDVVITGGTFSLDFPVASAVQPSYAGGDWDAFVVKLNAGGACLWATYYGGSDDEYAHDIVTNGSGNVVITGWTTSRDFPVAGAVQTSYAGAGDAFIVYLTSNGTLTTAEATPAPAGYDLYPNPAAGDVLLGIPVQVQGITHQIEVYDNLGRLVQREQMQAGRASYGLSTRMLAPGVYRIVLRANATPVFTRMFIRM